MKSLFCLGAWFLFCQVAVVYAQLTYNSPPDAQPQIQLNITVNNSATPNKFYILEGQVVQFTCPPPASANQAYYHYLFVKLTVNYQYDANDAIDLNANDNTNWQNGVYTFTRPTVNTPYPSKMPGLYKPFWWVISTDGIQNDSLKNLQANLNLQMSPYRLSASFRTSNKKGIYTINSVRAEDAGWYACVLSVADSDDSDTFNLNPFKYPSSASFARLTVIDEPRTVEWVGSADSVGVWQNDTNINLTCRYISYSTDVVVTLGLFDQNNTEQNNFLVGDVVEFQLRGGAPVRTTRARTYASSSGSIINHPAFTYEMYTYEMYGTVTLNTNMDGWTIKCKVHTASPNGNVKSEPMRDLIHIKKVASQADAQALAPIYVDYFKCTPNYGNAQNYTITDNLKNYAGIGYTITCQIEVGGGNANWFIFGNSTLGFTRSHYAWNVNVYQDDARKVFIESNQCSDVTTCAAIHPSLNPQAPVKMSESSVNITMMIKDPLHAQKGAIQFMAQLPGTSRIVYSAYFSLSNTATSQQQQGGGSPQAGQVVGGSLATASYSLALILGALLAALATF